MKINIIMIEDGINIVMIEDGIIIMIEDGMEFCKNKIQWSLSGHSVEIESIFRQRKFI